MDFVDLHTHTQASDGSDSPSELVRRAALLKLRAVAITDHDTLGGLEEAEAQGRDSGLEVVRGCEISSTSPYGEVHILGLWLPRDTAELETTLSALRAHRQERNKIIVSRLRHMGLPLTYDDVLDVANGETVGRPHIAAVMMDKGYVPSIRQAFREFLGSNGQAYVPKKCLDMNAAVSLLHRMGATVCMAHPCLISCPENWLDQILPQLKALGLSALEAYHSEHSDVGTRHCVELAARHGLELSGGSDYHGSVKPGIELGMGHGGLRVPYFVLEKLKAARQARGLPLA